MTEAKTAATQGGLYAALAKVQAELPAVAKNETADTGSYKYEYAGLDSVTAAIMPVLGKHGLAFTAKPTLTSEGRFVLRYILGHGPSGEKEDGEYPLPEKATPQQIGSAITYGRRYCLCAVTGVAPGGEDDDGRSAQQAPAADWRHPPPRPMEQLPRNEDGSLSRSQITDEELALAGAMTGAQQKEHTALRKGAVTGKPAKPVERIRGKAPGDEWTITPEDLIPLVPEVTDKKWYADIAAETMSFTSQGMAGEFRRRVSEAEEGGGCSETDADRLREMIRDRQKALATAGGSDAA